MACDNSKLVTKNEYCSTPSSIFEGVDSLMNSKHDGFIKAHQVYSTLLKSSLDSISFLKNLDSLQHLNNNRILKWYAIQPFGEASWRNLDRDFKTWPIRDYLIEDISLKPTLDSTSLAFETPVSAKGLFSSEFILYQQDSLFTIQDINYLQALNSYESKTWSSQKNHWESYGEFKFLDTTTTPQFRIKELLTQTYLSLVDIRKNFLNPTENPGTLNQNNHQIIDLYLSTINEILNIGNQQSIISCAEEIEKGTASNYTEKFNALENELSEEQLLSLEQFIKVDLSFILGATITFTDSDGD